MIDRITIAFVLQGCNKELLTILNTCFISTVKVCHRQIIKRIPFFFGLREHKGRACKSVSTVENAVYFSFIELKDYYTNLRNRLSDQRDTPSNIYRPGHGDSAQPNL